MPQQISTYIIWIPMKFRNTYWTRSCFVAMILFNVCYQACPFQILWSTKWAFESTCIFCLFNLFLWNYLLCNCSINFLFRYLAVFQMCLNIFDFKRILTITRCFSVKYYIICWLVFCHIFWLKRLCINWAL